MSEQQDNPKRSVAVPVLIALLAVAAFGYAFYALDGVALVSDLLGLTTSSQATERDPGEVSTEPAQLQLPDGMSEEFALRIWQEQVDSQVNIKRLVEGEVERIVVNDVAQAGDEATLEITAEFSDGSSLPGRLGMREFGDVWYFSYVSGMRAESEDPTEAAPPATELPAIEDVDVALLNTILEQQAASSAVLGEYASGAITDVRIDQIVPGTGNTTLKIVMNEDHEVGNGEVVVISKKIDGEDMWFIARFTKVAAQ